MNGHPVFSLPHTSRPPGGDSLERLDVSDLRLERPQLSLQRLLRRVHWSSLVDSNHNYGIFVSNSAENLSKFDRIWPKSAPFKFSVFPNLSHIVAD